MDSDHLLHRWFDGDGLLEVSQSLGMVHYNRLRRHYFLLRAVLDLALAATLREAGLELFLGAALRVGTVLVLRVDKDLEAT